MPSITTLIPTFRRPDRLRRAILSACRQSAHEVIVHVFDNASGDNTPDIVRELQQTYPLIRYTSRAKNIGALENFAAAVAAVETPYFSILSDDDYLLPEFYRHAVDALDMTPEAMFWIGATLNVGPDDRVWDARLLRWPRDGLYSPPQGAAQFLGGNAAAWTGMVFRREVLDAAPFIDVSLGGPCDLDYTLRLACMYPFLVRRIPVAVLHLSADSFSTTSPLSSFWPGWKRIIERFQNHPDLDAQTRHALSSQLHRDARSMLVRRAIHGIAFGRDDFVEETVHALRQDEGLVVVPGLLRLALTTFQWIPASRHLTRAVYRTIERRLVASRQSVLGQYNKLLSVGLPNP